MISENFRKIWKIKIVIVIFKNSEKICHKQNVKCLVFFQVN